MEIRIPSNAVGKVMGRGGGNLDNIRRVCFIYIFFFFFTSSFLADHHIASGHRLTFFTWYVPSLLSLFLSDIRSYDRNIWFKIFFTWRSHCSHFRNAWTEAYRRELVPSFYHVHLSSFALPPKPLLPKKCVPVFLARSPSITLVFDYGWVCILSSRLSIFRASIR